MRKIRKPQYEHIVCVHTYIIIIHAVLIPFLEWLNRELDGAWILGFGESESNLEPCDLIGFVGLDGSSKYTKNTTVRP